MRDRWWRVDHRLRIRVMIGIHWGSHMVDLLCDKIPRPQEGAPLLICGMPSIHKVGARHHRTRVDDNIGTADWHIEHRLRFVYCSTMVAV